VFLSYVNSAVAYANSTALFGTGLGALQASILAQADGFNPDGSSDETVIAGYKAIYDTTVNKILTSPIGQIELLFANNADGSIRITAALQHPFSQGRIYITSSDPMDYPIIDPNYLSHPAGTFLPTAHSFLI
jgi:choline dehydrogenase